MKFLSQFDIIGVCFGGVGMAFRSNRLCIMNAVSHSLDSVVNNPALLPSSMFQQRIRKLSLHLWLNSASASILRESQLLAQEALLTDGNQVRTHDGVTNPISIRIEHISQYETGLVMEISQELEATLFHGLNQMYWQARYCFRRRHLFVAYSTIC